MRLVDADALTTEIATTVSKAAINAWEIGTHTYIETLDRVAERQHEIIDMIDKAPTINPDDLRSHGWWIINPDGCYPYCSECKGEPKHGEMTKYCPNCGAKMNGKEQGR